MTKRVPETKDQFAVVSPVTKTGRYLICSRRIGSKERLTPIAECRSEEVALRIVEGLHLRQAEETKINTSAEATVAALRAELASERAKRAGVETDRSGLQQRLREAERKVDDLTQQRNRLQQQLAAVEPVAREVSRQNTAALMKG